MLSVGDSMRNKRTDGVSHRTQQELIWQRCKSASKYFRPNLNYSSTLK